MSRQIPWAKLRPTPGKCSPLGHSWSQEMCGMETWFNGNYSVAGKQFIYILQGEVVTIETGV